MPIAINGSGTLTGISTGGISDTKALATAGLPAGTILQVVYGTYTTAVSSTSGSYVDTGLSKSITPLQTGSNILVQVEQNILVNRSSDAAYGAVKIVQDSTDRFVNANTYQMGFGATGTSAVNLRFPMVISSFHAHGVSAGTSTTYKTQMIVHQTSSSGSITAQNGSSASKITIMEVAA